MGLQSAAPVLLLIALAFAGCAGGADPEPSETTGSSSSTTPSGPPPNQAPTGTIQVSAANGSVPLTVNFTLDGHDADKDNLTWTLSFGDGDATNGTELPATVSHNYTAPGNLTVLYIISDGIANATYNATLNLTASGEATLTLEPLHFAGGAELACLHCFAQYNVCPDILAGVNEGACFYFEVPPEAVGRSATFSNSNGAVSVDFMADCSGSGAGVDYASDAASPYEAEIPNGAGCVLLYDSTLPLASFTVDVV
jgi:PKD repeat protein